MHIRSATITDAEIVLNWSNNKALWAVENPGAYAPKDIEEFQPQWQAIVAQQSAWIIEIENAAVGHIGWVSHAASVYEFYIVLADPSASGRGIGQASMHWLFEEAEAQGLTALYGRVLGNNPRALNFFSQLGAVELGRSENYFERGGMTHDLIWIRFDLLSNVQAVSA